MTWTYITIKGSVNEVWFSRIACVAHFIHDCGSVLRSTRKCLVGQIPVVLFNTTPESFLNVTAAHFVAVSSPSTQIRRWLSGDICQSSCCKGPPIGPASTLLFLSLAVRSSSIFFRCPHTHHLSEMQSWRGSLVTAARDHYLTSYFT